MADANNYPVWPGWETVRLIGRGSFGAVYEIKRDEYGSKESAALKVISIPQNSADIEELYDSGYDKKSVIATFESHMKSIVNEYSLMREMNGSANVVNCDDFSAVPHDDNIGWDIHIRMELLTPLPKAVSRDIPESEVIKIAVHMCNALILCKKYNIVHRDIKPQNIFVSRNGDYKLGDFGIAKTVERTMGGTKTGTYKYMAPEVYNNQPYGSAADIYSLGLVLHWLLNERRSPFMPLPPEPASATEEEHARLRRFQGEPIPAPKNGSKELKRIVLKACAYEVKDRYHTADEMLSDLETIAGGKSAPVTPLAPVDEPEPKPDEGGTETVGLWNRSKGSEQENEGTETVGLWNKPKPDKSKESRAETTKKKRPAVRAIIAAVLLLAIIAGAVGVGGFRRYIYQEDWTEWTEKLPKGIDEEKFIIEEQVQYRSRNKETTSSATTDKMDGWTLDTITEEGMFGAWSDWSENAVTESDRREVETQTRYRSRNLDTTESSEPSMSGWEPAETTYTWGDYGTWSEWGTNELTTSESRKIETKKQYSYRTKSTKSVGSNESTDLNGWVLYDTSKTYGQWSEWSDGVDAVDMNYNPEYEQRDVKTGSRYYVAHYCTGDTGDDNRYKSANWKFDDRCSYHELGWYDGEKSLGSQVDAARCSNTCWIFYVMDTQDIYKTQYRWRSVSTTNSYYKWSDWSAYSDTYKAPSDTTEVRTRTLYRCCDREQIPTYHFQRWDEWSDWSPRQISQSSTNQVENTTFYRYRDMSDQTIYIFSRWGDWTDWVANPIADVDENEVETRILYRYKSK